MTPPLSATDVGALLEHAGWIQSLARTLAREREQAEDLSQETWLRLLERPPRLDRPFRGWIATAMRNLARAERRGALRRSDRERSCASEEVQPSGLDLLARVAVQRELVQAVLELEEPHRTAILLRYFEERSPTAIAAQLGVPVATVKARLARGLARLRERLARAAGPDGRASMLACLAWIEGRASAVSPALPLTLGALAVKTKIALALLVLLAAGASLFLITDEESSAPEVERRSLAAAPEAPDSPAETPSRAPGAEPTQREAVPAPVRAARADSSEAPRAAALPSVRGRVLDDEARPVAGVAVGLRPEDQEGAAASPALVRTASDGSFTLEFPGPSGRLAVIDERWTTILEGTPVDATFGKESLIVVAPRIELSGTVLDEFGLLVEGAHVRLEPPAGLRSRLSAVLDFSAPVHWTATSDPAGRFRFDVAPSLADARIAVRAEGFLPLEESAPLSSRADVVLVLARPPLTTSELTGKVVDSLGQPVKGALVSLGIDTTTSDERGLFAFRLDDPETSNRMFGGFIEPDVAVLRAVKPGYLPGELRARARDEQGQAIWPESVVLRLGDEPLAIAGVALGAGGQALPRIQVWIADPTFFGGLRDPSGGFPRLTHLETVLAGAEPGWHSVTTDRQGRFEIEGLLDRDYTVAAMDPETLLRVDTEHVRAGERSLRIVFPAGASYPLLRGQVVDSRGAPIVNAAVFPMCDAFRTRIQGETVSTQHAATEAVRTDAEGRFELQRVPRDLVYLRIEGPDTIPLEWGRHVEGGLRSLIGERNEDLRIAVERRCHFQVELARPDEADQLGLLDDAGNPLVISEFLGNSRRDTERHELVNGRSSTLAASDSARWLVLFKDGSEVLRLPIALAPGEPTVVRP